LAIPYRLYGVLITGGVLVPLSFANFIIDLLRHDHARYNYVAALTIALIGATAALAVVLLQQRDAADQDRAAAPFAVILRRQWLPIGLVILLAGLCFWIGAFNAHDAASGSPLHSGYSAHEMEKWTPQVLLPVGVVNLAMIVFSLWLIRVGLNEDRSLPFAAGVLYFLLWAVLRYVDLFAGVGGMLGAAAMFLLCGLGLAAVARFWQHRKESEPKDLPSPFGRGAGGEGGGETQQAGNVASPHDALTLTLSQRERGPEALPAWLERVAGWLKSRQRTVLAAALVLQLAVLVGMIVFQAGLLLTGKAVLLRVVPVDPRDLLRGDYVALSYEFSRVPRQGIPELGKRSNDRQGDWQGKTVYVSLVPEEDGEHWRAERFSINRPQSGTYLRGTITGWDNITFGIESYYVQEGTGKEYEEAARGRRLSAEVAVASDGHAALRGVRIEAAAPAAGPAYGRQGAFRWPTNTVYRVRRLRRANLRIDGRSDEPEWSRANVERHFLFPWKKTDAPLTEFQAFCDDRYLYFAFRVEDSDIVVLDKLRDKEDECFEDRVELLFSRDSQMQEYYALEIDSRGRVFDYRGSYYRQLDTKWNCKGVEATAVPIAKGYAVEGRIPLSTLAEMGCPKLRPNDRILCGIFRAEFSHDRSGKPVEHKETIHNRGRKLDGPPPIEEWISWIDPKTPEPDFHIPSALGWLEIVE
jgi:uncharacterized membrane-anchored protein